MSRRSAFRRKPIIATTISSASSPSRSRMAKAPRKVEVPLAASGASAASARSNRASSRSTRAATSSRRRAAPDRRAQPAHLALDLGDQAAVAGAEQRLDRLEAVEIGGQRQLAGLVAVAAPIGGEALPKQFVGDGQRLRPAGRGASASGSARR